jgi:membrane peptidoglycan carboxypeptidase
MVTKGDVPTGENRVVARIDLSEAYAAVRRRGKALRRRRIISSVLAGVVLAAVFTVVGVYYVSTIPLPDALSLPATTTVYYSDGRTVMARLGSQNRMFVDSRTLPAYVAAAVVAAEDPGYWRNSTTLISRQYARAATGVDDSTIAGEARLIVMSLKLEDSYSKVKILDFYLNTVYFGRGAYGIEAAAQAYFGKRAAALTKAEAIVLAGVIAAPGDGRFDPTVDLLTARKRFAGIAGQMVAASALDESEAQSLAVPRVLAYDPASHESDLDRPTGLVVAQVLAELRQAEPFRGKPAGFIENGGYTIVTTVDARAQDLLERTASEAVGGSVMAGQPDNLQAAAVVVQPGTGRVLAYFGGSNGTGADYAGLYYAASGRAVGFGAHPPGQTVDVYTLAAALSARISVRSMWSSPESKDFPASGRTADNPVRDFGGAACQPRCSLADATTSSLNVPYYSLTQKIGAASVIDMARAAGIDAMWVPASATAPRERVDLRGRSGAAVTPTPFGNDMALGDYPVTVVDQANAMATFAAGGRRADVHFVDRVSRNLDTVVATRPASPRQVLDPAAVNDLTWTLAQNPAGQLPDGWASASKTGTGPLRTSQVETAHAWLIGYTPNLAMAVWVGNQDMEFPLRDSLGTRVIGSGLPADIYRRFVPAAQQTLGLPKTGFPEPSFGGDAGAGDG